MKKRSLLALMLLAASTLSLAKVDVSNGKVTISDTSFTETIPAALGPSVRINYKKFDLDIGNLDFHRHTGYLNAIIYPADAEIRPRLISGLLKGRGGFEVNRYKTITFHSNHINWSNDNRATSFTGILSAKNRSIPVTFQRRKFDCKAEAGGHRTCKAHFHAEVDRTKLDLNQGTSFGMSKQAPIELTFTMRD